MTLGSKLTRLRKEHNETQEQFAERWGVSRQAVSKWESDLAYPETDKLVRIGELYHCSMDYLFRENVEDPSGSQPEAGTASDSCNASARSIPLYLSLSSYEKKSRKMIGSVPLWHICFDRRKAARGVIAIGFRSKGVLSVGLLSLGIFSVGLLPIGLISLGVLALGIIAAGSISLGVIAVGAIAVGILSLGALAVGEYALGALAVGKYAALGDHAHGAVAIGKTFAEGSLFTTTDSRSMLDLPALRQTILDHAPTLLRWAAALFTHMI